MRRSRLVVACLAPITLLCLACMAAGSWRGTLAAAQGAERTSKDNGVQYKSPYDRELIQESQGDENLDGQPDLWGVDVRRGTPHALLYIYADNNADDLPERIRFSVGTPERIVYEVCDKTRDGVMDYARVALLSFWDPKRICVYTDMNMDGRLDLVTQYLHNKPVRRYIMMGDRLIPVDLDRGDPCEKGYRLQNKTAGDQRMVFDREKGTWCREPAPPTADDKP